jgi:hypothetical protein
VIKAVQMASLERLRELGETAAEQAVEPFANLDIHFLCGQEIGSSQYWWALVLQSGTVEQTYSYPLNTHLFFERDLLVVDIFKALMTGAIRDFLMLRGTDT